MKKSAASSSKKSEQAENQAENLFIHANLKLLRTRRGKTQADVASAAGLSRSQLAGYETGISPTLEALVRLADYFEISVDTLLRQNLQNWQEFELRQLELGKEHFISGKHLRVLATTVNPENEDNVEAVSQSARAGYLNGYADPEFISELPSMHLPFVSKQRKHRVFQIAGDSMLPVLPGSWVVGEYVDDWYSLKDGERCVVVTATEGIVLKLVYNRFRENEPGLLLCSTNPVYPPFFVPALEIREIWRYRWVIAE